MQPGVLTSSSGHQTPPAGPCCSAPPGHSRGPAPALRWTRPPACLHSKLQGDHARMHRCFMRKACSSTRCNKVAQGRAAQSGCGRGIWHCSWRRCHSPMHCGHTSCRVEQAGRRAWRLSMERTCHANVMPSSSLQGWAAEHRTQQAGLLSTAPTCPHRPHLMASLIPGSAPSASSPRAAKSPRRCGRSGAA